MSAESSEREAKLQQEVDSLVESMQLICRDYCRWYDKGFNGMDGGAIAYHLVGHARLAIARHEDGCEKMES